MDRRDYFGSFGQLLPRERRVDHARKILFITLEDEEGGEMEYEFPIKFCVCGTCDGSGTHVNPSIDAHGLSREDFDEDPDFAESYFRGDYDQTCNECNGQRVVPEIDEKNAEPEALKLLQSWQKSEAEYRQCCAAERRYGA